VSVIYHIRKHILGLPLNEICFTRDFLAYGQRTTIDTSLWRLVGRGMLLRVADGIFVREGSKIPTLEEIVKAKAAKFGKQIVEFCGKFADKLTSGHDDWRSESSCSDDVGSDNPDIQIFGTDAQTSSFDTIHGRVKLVRVAGRKRSMGECKAAKATRALWHMKKRRMKDPDISWTTTALSTLNRDDRQKLTALIRWMPAWLSNQFVRRVRPQKVLPHNPAIGPA